MKIQSIELKYFKRFGQPPVFDFTDAETGLAKDLIVLIGMNGAGKTSILQAIFDAFGMLRKNPSGIAATLGVATGRLKKLSDLEWRAVFPMAMDFASWNIHNSVILIDELELHLYPPMEQALLSALPKLGKNNQFIITTHSDYVESLVPEENIVRI